MRSRIDLLQCQRQGVWCKPWQNDSNYTFRTMQIAHEERMIGDHQPGWYRGVELRPYYTIGMKLFYFGYRPHTRKENPACFPLVQNTIHPLWKLFYFY